MIEAKAETNRMQTDLKTALGYQDYLRDCLREGHRHFLDFGTYVTNRDLGLNNGHRPPRLTMDMAGAWYLDWHGEGSRVSVLPQETMQDRGLPQGV